MKDELIKKLEELLNDYSKDNECETPDFILAEYLIGCLDAYKKATKANIEWHSDWKTLDEKLEV